MPLETKSNDIAKMNPLRARVFQENDLNLSDHLALGKERMAVMLLTINGAQVYYEQHGTASENVLLLHGWGCDTTFFAPITQTLSETMKVTVLDFPGHGKSSRPPEPWGVPEYGEMVRELMDTLKIAPCFIIGHSFGGRVAIYLGSHWPQHVRRMILTGAAGLKKPPTEEQTRRAKRYQAMKAGFSILKRMRIFGDLPDKASEGLRKRYGSKDYNALDEEMRKTFVKIVTQDLQPLLPLISSSTLLVWGDQDTETPLWMGQTMAKEIPDAGLAVFEGGSHFAYLEQWKRFVRVAQHFFEGVSS